MISDLAPFAASIALNTEILSTATTSQSAEQSAEITSHVPDEPTITLSPTAVHEFLHQELQTAVLDDLYPNLWLVARKSGKSIDALHQTNTSLLTEL